MSSCTTPLPVLPKVSIAYTSPSWNATILQVSNNAVNMTVLVNLKRCNHHKRMTCTMWKMLKYHSVFHDIHIYIYIIYMGEVICTWTESNVTATILQVDNHAANMMVLVNLKRCNYHIRMTCMM